MSSQSDLTARARIRDAAITLIAERGAKATTIRDIADAAGVSSGLLRHHFGSKEGLRDACDEWVQAELTRVRGAALAGSQDIFAALQAVPVRLQNYVLRSTMDGSPAGERMFDAMVQQGETWIATTDVKTDDPRAYAAVLVALKMGMFILREQISRAIGEDTTEPAGQARMLRASLEIFSRPLVGPELADQMYAALDKFAEEAGR
ncbi:TetR/AcrR family transcriptional regulator [Actinoplanes sp. RD1]|uniref:TetR/AcrR family transcriptional regulator n=1 Tax=Actinoplanes sp. RD1 TaxID=3064538 RepID=UPI0027411DD0|nr:TetR/AcrR family transcriptional regulator [Actinoplanes sp. RD1]